MKLWTQDRDRLVEKLERTSGAKTSALEGLGRLERDRADQLASRNPQHFASLKSEQVEGRTQARDRLLVSRLSHRASGDHGLPARLASGALNMSHQLDRYLTKMMARNDADGSRSPPRDVQKQARDRGGDHGLDR